jgi:hypothetical protein
MTENVDCQPAVTIEEVVNVGGEADSSAPTP